MICRILQILSFHPRVLSLPSSLPLSFSWVSGAGRSHKPDRSVSLEAKKSAAVGSSMGWTGDFRLADAWVWSAQLLAVTKCCWRELQLGWASQTCYHENGHELGSKSPTLVYCFINATNMYEFSFRKSSTDPNEHSPSKTRCAKHHSPLPAVLRWDSPRAGWTWWHWSRAAGYAKIQRHKASQIETGWNGKGNIYARNRWFLNLNAIWVNCFDVVIWNSIGFSPESRDQKLPNYGASNRHWNFSWMKANMSGVRSHVRSLKRIPKSSQ